MRLSAAEIAVDAVLLWFGLTRADRPISANGRPGAGTRCNQIGSTFDQAMQAQKRVLITRAAAVECVHALPEPPSL